MRISLCGLWLDDCCVRVSVVKSVDFTTKSMWFVHGRATYSDLLNAPSAPSHRGFRFRSSRLNSDGSSDGSAVTYRPGSEQTATENHTLLVYSLSFSSCWSLTEGFYRRIPDPRPLSFAGFSLGTVLPLSAARKTNTPVLNVPRLNTILSLFTIKIGCD